MCDAEGGASGSSAEPSATESDLIDMPTFSDPVVTESVSLPVTDIETETESVEVPSATPTAGDDEDEDSDNEDDTETGDGVDDGEDGTDSEGAEGDDAEGDSAAGRAEVAGWGLVAALAAAFAL